MKLENLSNRQLIKFISRESRHALTGELEQEFRNRAIDPNEVSKIRHEIELEYEELDILQNESLSSTTKILIISFPIIIPLYIIMLEWLILKAPRKNA